MEEKAPFGKMIINDNCENLLGNLLKILSGSPLG